VQVGDVQAQPCLYKAYNLSSTSNNATNHGHVEKVTLQLVW